MTTTATLPTTTAATLAAELGKATLSLREIEAAEALEAAKRGARIQRRRAAAERAEVAAALTPAGRAAAAMMTPVEVIRLANAATGAAQRAAARRGAPRLTDDVFSDTAADVAAYILTAGHDRPDTPPAAALARRMMSASYGTAAADIRLTEAERTAERMLWPLRSDWPAGRAYQRAAGLLAERNGREAGTTDAADATADLGDPADWNSSADPDTLADALAAADRPLSAAETVALDAALGVTGTGVDHAAALGVKLGAYRVKLHRGRKDLAKRWPDAAALAADLAAARMADPTPDERAALAESNTAAAMRNAERHTAGHAGGVLTRTTTDTDGKRHTAPASYPVASFYLTTATPGEALSTVLAAASTAAVARAIHRDPDPCPYRRAGLIRAARLAALYRAHRAAHPIVYPGDGLAAVAAALRTLLAPAPLRVIHGTPIPDTLPERRERTIRSYIDGASYTTRPLADTPLPTTGRPANVLRWINAAEKAAQTC